MGLNVHIRKLILVLFIVQAVLHTYGQKSKKFFRKDYTYFNTTESFYKINTLKKTWLEAKKWCELEGATMFYPGDDEEAKNIVEFWKRTQLRFSCIFIGISDLLAKGMYETIDGRPISDVYSNWGAEEPNDAGGVEDCVTLNREGMLSDDRCDRKYPFVCKKTLEDVQWNHECDMPMTDYVYNATLGRCYKFHTDPQSWPEAFRVCSAELSYLAVANSRAEADYLVQLSMQSKLDKVRGVAKPAEVLLGFHNRYGDGWRTITGERLEESGYSMWGDKNPDGGDKEQCGSMFFNHIHPRFNGHLNDLGCNERCFYICEHDINSLANSIDDRFNDLA